MLLEMQEAQQAERNAITQVQHYEGLGIGLAAMCVAMYTTLCKDGTFSKEQGYELVKAAVSGR